MFLTGVASVKGGVDFHSSRPLIPSSALQRRVPPTSVRSRGWLSAEAVGVVLMSATSVALVKGEADFQSSRPFGMLSALKRRVPLMSMSGVGLLSSKDLMSSARVVLSESNGDSDFQSS